MNKGSRYILHRQPLPFLASFRGGHQGDRFLMENASGKLVRRSMEGGKLVATAMDMVQERVNKSTRDTEAVVFVQDEKSRTVSVRAGRGEVLA